MNVDVAYWLPRVSAIVISYIAVAFLSVSTVRVSSIEVVLSIVVGISATAGIWYQWARTDRRYLSFLPAGVLAAYLIVFFLGGFGLDFLRFIFLMMLASTPMWINFYAWQNPRMGGAFYIGLGIFYLLIGFRQVAWLAMVLVVGFLVQTGTLFVVGQPQNKP